jgi:hypothetical protein
MSLGDSNYVVGLHVFAVIEVWGFELTASCLLDKHPPTRTMLSSPFFFIFFSERVLCFCPDWPWPTIIPILPPE